MALTSAQRQARYRERVKARLVTVGETAEAMIERLRQSVMADWIGDAREAAAPGGDEAGEARAEAESAAARAEDARAQ